jgi:hypothetical protein
LIVFAAMSSPGADTPTALPGSLPALTPPASPPRIAFEELVHDFGEIRPNQVVNHSFIFTNTGGETLVISEVRPGCGCTTAGAWDKEVAPGKTGAIPLQFNSSGFSGPVAKGATVTCNDPTQGNLYLQLKGRVWTPLEYSPSMLSFQFDPENFVAQTQVVRVVNHTTAPLTIEVPQLTNRAFKLEFQTVTPGKEFQARVTTVPPLGSGMISDYLRLKTSSAEMPLINVPIYAFARPPVSISPSQIILPTSPLPAAAQYTVTIQSFSTNALTLSDVKINLPGAEVKMNPAQPGKLYLLNINFPAGLALKADQNVVVTAKSSHPRFPLVQVPVYQRQPVAAPAPAAKTFAPGLPPGIRFETAPK